MTAPKTAEQYDAAVIGGGINGLTCAALLAKAGVRTVLLEKRTSVGGCATQHEIAPGFSVPALSHAAGPIRRDIVDELQLYVHGLKFHDAALDVSTLLPDGRSIVLWNDARRTAEGLREWSTHDAGNWIGFRSSIGRIGSLIGALCLNTPPSVDTPNGRDLWALMRTVSAFRSLPKDDQWRLLRWGPMAVADLVSEPFESEPLRATLAADGIFGAMLGPWSAGSGLQLLMSAANRALAWPGGHAVEGGPSAVIRSIASAAQRFGVETRTGADVAGIQIKDDRAHGVTLVNGDVITARSVVSAVDPKRTFLTLCEADHLPPEFLWRMKHYRARGTVAKLNLALGSLPAFKGATREMLAGRVRIGPDLDYLERAFDDAKYGRFSTRPWIEFTIPSIDNPKLTPQGAHVLSAYIQFAPYRLRDSNWDESRDAMRNIALDTLSEYAPDLRSSIVAEQLLTPLDLERGWGLTGGHIFHGELSLDQFFTMRPLLGFGQYQTPVKGLFLCGSGTHPGTGFTGGSGANAAREIVRQLK